MKSKHKYNPDDVFADDESHAKLERAKARELRHSRWWHNKLQQGLCHYCGQKFKPEELTMDHVIPLARGGMSTKNNLVTACKACNNKKKQNLSKSWEDLTSLGAAKHSDQ